MRGLIYYTGTDELKLRNVKCRGVQYKANSTSPGGLFYRTTVVNNPLLNVGQGGINFFGQSGWRIELCDISGFGDGIQAGGNGTIIGTWVHDFVITSESHNDGVQLYEGKVLVYDSVFDMGDNLATMSGHSNGALFTSETGTEYEAWNLYVNTVRGTSTVNALNAVRGIIRVHSGKIVGGGLPGTIVLDPGVERIA